jgi:hypothetical protein
MLFVLALPGRAAADPTEWQYWPELAATVRTSPETKLFFLANTTREEDFDRTEYVLGAHFDYSLLPRIRIAIGDLDPERKNYLTARVGFRYRHSLGEDDITVEKRPVLELTPRFPAPGNVLVSFRNRLDLRWINADYSWRYRPRLRAEREFALGAPRALAPYVSAEAYFDSRFDDWSRARYTAGIEATFTRRTMLDVSYCRQDDTHPLTTHVNALGVSLNLFF